MTVAELIEKLKELHGDAELRLVVCDVEAHRPYAQPTRFRADISSIALDGGEAHIKAWGWLE